ncbi:HigA family addiction module antitoxin [Rhizobium sp. PAMB 3182]
MTVTKRRPVSPGEILIEEFLEPLNLTQGHLAEAMGVPRKHINELCTGRRAVTVSSALLLAKVFGTSADFWLNVQRRLDLWNALHSDDVKKKLDKVRPVQTAA